MTDFKEKLRQLSANCRANDSLSKFACFREEADAIDAALSALEANAALIALLRASMRKVEDEVEGLRRDSEILRTLIYRTHACDLKFTKTGGVSALSATFRSNTVPGIGMSEGVRRYLDAFMQDAALVKGDSNGGSYPLFCPARGLDMQERIPRHGAMPWNGRDAYLHEREGLRAYLRGQRWCSD